MQAFNGNSRAAYLFCSILGLGRLPYLPGTAGSAAALLILFVPDNYLVPVLLVLLPVLFYISMKAIAKVEQNSGLSDPSFIIIDELIGMWVLLLLPVSRMGIYWTVLALLIFRIYDIAKPYPLNKINQMQGPFWVLIDDVIAAVMSAITLYLLYLGFQALALVLLIFFK
ncbi:MAG: phosphatidylglycerophosphatase A [Bacteroidota bacterium]